MFRCLSFLYSLKHVFHGAAECSNESVFVGADGDTSLPPAFTVLPTVIEKSKRSVIVHGLADYILIAEG
jgi:carboxypeptidase D